MDCPSRETIESFLRNELADGEFEGCLSHVDDCSTCRDLLEELTGGATVERIREGWLRGFASGGVPAFPVDLLPSIEGFRVVREVGRGGMGVVFEAEEELLGRRVALKILTAGPPLDPKWARRFLNEARAASRLYHPNIVPVFGVGRQDGLHYYAMQYIEGPSLSVVLDALREMRASGPAEAVDEGAGPLAMEIARSLATGRFAGSPPEGGPPGRGPDRRHFLGVARVGVQAAEALHHAHFEGILHRDVKPSNLLIDARGVVWVADFGLAKSGEDGDLTATGELPGTPRYLAPERFDGRCDARSDVYSLGLTLYELAALRPAYEAAGKLELLALVRLEEPPRLRSREPRVPADLEAIIHKAIARDPAARYANALELAEDLGRFLRGEPIRARRLGALRLAWRWARRNPWRAVAAATLLGSSAAIVAIVARHNVELRAEVRRTEAKASEARRNYSEARSTIQAMLGLLRDARFAETPRMMELGGAQMEEAFGFYERILRLDESNDPTVRADTAEAFGVLSTLKSGSGKAEDAERLVRRALELAEGLLAERPDDATMLGLRVLCTNRLAIYLKDRGRVEEAIATGGRAVRLAEGLIGATPESLPHRELLAVCHDSLAGCLQQARRPDEAHEEFRKAIEIRGALDPKLNPDLIPRHLETLANDGVAVWSMNRPDEAEAIFREVAGRWDEVPPERRVVASQARVYVNWSGVLNTRERYDESIARVEEGLALLGPYREREPSDAVARDVALGLYGNRAYARGGRGDHPGSAEDWARVIELSPSPVPHNYRARLAIELIQIDQLDPALVQAQLIRPGPEIAGPDSYNIACILARAAKRVRGDAGIPEFCRRPLVERLRSEAMGWLVAAAKSGIFDVPDNLRRIRDDPDLDEVRGLAEFRVLLDLPGRIRP